MQWLLIGGPGHGKTLWIKQGSRVSYTVPVKTALHRPGGKPIKDQASYLYDGENYLHEGRLYRIGKHNPTPAQLDQISTLIRSTGLHHIAGD